MIKKIIQLSDVHIRNIQMHENTKEAINIFVKDIKKLREIYSYDEMRIVIVGDLFHQKINVSNEQFVLGYKILKTFLKFCPVIIIAGNHDLLENNKERLDSITPIVDVIEDKNLKYYKESKCYLDDNVVWSVYSIFNDNLPPDISLAKIEFGTDKTFIGLFHAPVVGSKTDIGYEITHGVNITYFEGCDIVLLGDIHKYQEFKLGDTPILFCGSFIQQNFGETINKHGYVIWDVETKKYELKEIDISYGFYKFEISSINDIENGKEKLVNII